MTIRRIRRTIVVEYVTDRADGDLPVVNRRDIGSGRVVSDVVAVVDAKVAPRVAGVEALVSQGDDPRRAAEMFDRQRAASNVETAVAVARAAGAAAKLAGGDPALAAREAYLAELARLEAEQLKEIIV